MSTLVYNFFITKRLTYLVKIQSFSFVQKCFVGTDKATKIGTELAKNELPTVKATTTTPAKSMPQSLMQEFPPEDTFVPTNNPSKPAVEQYVTVQDPMPQNSPQQKQDLDYANYDINRNIQRMETHQIQAANKVAQQKPLQSESKSNPENKTIHQQTLESQQSQPSQPQPPQVFADIAAAIHNRFADAAVTVAIHNRVADAITVMENQCENKINLDQQEAEDAKHEAEMKRIAEEEVEKTKDAKKSVLGEIEKLGKEKLDTQANLRPSQIKAEQEEKHKADEEQEQKTRLADEEKKETDAALRRVIDSLEKHDLIEYADASCSGGREKGSPRLSAKGREVAKALKLQPNPTLKTPINDSLDTFTEEFSNPSIQPEPEEQEQKVFTAVIITVDRETVIETPLQTHVCILKETNNSDELPQIVAFFTSDSGKKKGIEYYEPPANLKIGSVNILGQKQDQYVVPVIPPRTIRRDQFEYQQEAENYLNNPGVIPAITAIVDYVDKFKAIPYNPKIYSEDDLHEILVYYEKEFNFTEKQSDQEESSQQITDSTAENFPVDEIT